MYAITAPAVTDRVRVARHSERSAFPAGRVRNEIFAEQEHGARVERFLRAVSSGWPQVMTFLDTCDLDREARDILRRLQEDVSDHTTNGGHRP